MKNNIKPYTTEWWDDLKFQESIRAGRARSWDHTTMDKDKSKYREKLDSIFEIHKIAFEAGRDNPNKPYDKMMSDSGKFDKSIDLVYEFLEKGE